MPAAICIMARVMMKDGMPIIVTPTALMSPSSAQLGQREQDRDAAGHGHVGDR